MCRTAQAASVEVRRLGEPQLKVWAVEPKALSAAEGGHVVQGGGPSWGGAVRPVKGADALLSRPAVVR